MIGHWDHFGFRPCPREAGAFDVAGPRRGYPFPPPEAHVAR